VLWWPKTLAPIARVVRRHWLRFEFSYTERPTRSANSGRSRGLRFAIINDKVGESHFCARQACYSYGAERIAGSNQPLCVTLALPAPTSAKEARWADAVAARLGNATLMFSAMHDTHYIRFSGSTHFHGRG
jgi:hypothetical protein